MGNYATTWGIAPFLALKGLYIPGNKLFVDFPKGIVTEKKIMPLFTHLHMIKYGFISSKENILTNIFLSVMVDEE